MEIFNIIANTGDVVTIDKEDLPKLKGANVKVSQSTDKKVKYAYICVGTKITRLSTLIIGAGAGRKCTFIDGNTLNYCKSNILITGGTGDKQVRHSTTNSITVLGKELLFDKEDFIKLENVKFKIKSIGRMSINVSYTGKDKSTVTTTLQRFLWGTSNMSIRSKVGKCTDFRRQSVELYKPRSSALPRGLCKLYGVYCVKRVKGSTYYSTKVQNKGMMYTVNGISTELEASVLNNYIRRVMCKIDTGINNTGMSDEDEDTLSKHVLQTHRILTSRRINR